MHRAIVCLAVLFAVGCQSATPSGAEVATGQLGNGGFAFACDDSVACDRYTHAAKTFPDAIALSSTFRVTYVPKDSSSSATGITVGTVGETYLSPSSNGMTAIKAGWGTFVARDNAGRIVEFVTVPIVRPDALVVYDAAYVGDAPTRITKVSLAVGEVKSFRALARSKSFDLAGTLQYEWTGSADGVAQVDTQRATGKVAVTGLKAGTTQIKVAGSTFEETVSVEVTP